MRVVGVRAVAVRAVAVRAVAVRVVTVRVVTVVAVVVVWEVHMPAVPTGLSFGLCASHCGGLDVIEVGLSLGLQQASAGTMLWLGMLVDHYLALPHTDIAGEMVSC